MTVLTRDGQPDRRFLVAAAVVLVIGLVMLASASSATAFNRYGSAYYTLSRQIALGVIPGLIGFGFCYALDYRVWKRLAVPLFVISLAGLVAVLIPGVGKSFGGAQRWIGVGSVSFQPSEIAKLAFVIYLASWLSTRREVMHDFKKTFLPFTALLALVLGLIVIEPDLGTTVVVAIGAIGIYFVAGAPLRYLALLVTGGLVGVAGLIAVAPYRLARLLTFLEPSADPLGAGYHINQALLAVGSGGLWGRGYGHSRAKFQYLPEAASDSIFAVVAEELGFIFSLLFLCLIMYLFVRGLRIARQAPDEFGRLLGAGIALWFIGQTVVNVGAMIGLLPLTGIPLPLVSAGGTALAIGLSSVGILANISRYVRTPL